MSQYIYANMLVGDAHSYPFSIGFSKFVIMADIYKSCKTLMKTIFQIICTSFWNFFSILEKLLIQHVFEGSYLAHERPDFTIMKNWGFFEKRKCPSNFVQSPWISSLIQKRRCMKFICGEKNDVTVSCTAWRFFFLRTVLLQAEDDLCYSNKEMRN